MHDMLQDMVFAISGSHVWVSTFVGPLLVALCYPLIIYLRLVTAVRDMPLVCQCLKLTGLIEQPNAGFGESRWRVW